MCKGVWFGVCVSVNACLRRMYRDRGAYFGLVGLNERRRREYILEGPGVYSTEILKFRASKITRNAYIKPGKMLLNFYHHFLCFLRKNVNLNLTKIYGVHLMWQKIQIILRPILKFIFFYHLNWISPNRINKISRKRNKP